MTQVCSPAGHIVAARFTKIDPCAETLGLPGASNGYVANCIRSVEETPNIEEGEETRLQNDGGVTCWRNKLPDEVSSYTVNFQVLNPDYELASLISGAVLINDGDENIGFYLNDKEPTPLVYVELIEAIPSESCDGGYAYRMIVFPKIQFQPPGSERDGSMRVVTWTGTSYRTKVTALGEGPYGDYPVDFSTAPEGNASNRFEFYLPGVTSAPEGNCGFIAVPAAS